MALGKKLDTGTVLMSWNYETRDGSSMGQEISVRDKNTGGYQVLIDIGSRKTEKGVENRLVIKKSLAEKLGWVVIEE